MARATVEVVHAFPQTVAAKELLGTIEGVIRDAGDALHRTTEYHGDCEWLVLWGVGRAPRSEWRHRHIANGGKVLLWDLGYFGYSRRRDGYLRCSVNDDHPQRWLDKTPPNPSRWNEHGIELHEYYDPLGPIILAGLGTKSRAYGDDGWEREKYRQLRSRFPHRHIVYRPKPGHAAMALPCPVDARQTIEQVLKGASLLVCRHSNVAIDAAIYGVPFECEDGAAEWLMNREFTFDNRLDFLRRVSWWQWRIAELRETWAFIKATAA